MYDPTIRRFLSADPHVTDPLSGQSYNRYSYVVNNPTNLVDPTGFDWWDYGNGSWVSDGCFGQECGGGNAAETSPFDFGFGGYSKDPVSGTPSGTSGGAVAGGGFGAPLQASEKHRQMSLPTGPAAPAAAISGPQVTGQSPEFDAWLAKYVDERERRRQRLAENGDWGDPDHDIAWVEVNCPSCVQAHAGLYAAGAIILAANDLSHLENAVRNVFSLPSISVGGVKDSAPMNSVLENGATVRFSSTATAIGDDVHTLQNFARSRGAVGHDLVVHGIVVDGESQFLVNGIITHPNQIAEAVLANPAYLRGVPINLVTCHGACGTAQELGEILGVQVHARAGFVDLHPDTGVLRDLWK
jgi:hypothetical protein